MTAPEIWIYIRQSMPEVSPAEWAAVLFGITYVLLIAFRKRAGWYFAFASSVWYVFLSFRAKIYAESALQSFYCFMAVYGWYLWNKPEEGQLQITRWTFRKHLTNIFVSSILSVIMAVVLLNFTDQQSPFLDSFTTVFSLSATFMAAHRILENWLYWIVIDLALAVLYSQQELFLVGVNYLIFTGIAAFAFLSWYQSYRTQYS